jgi:hypothetical protein
MKKTLDTGVVIEWVVAAHGRKIVTMPDGSELTTDIICEKLNLNKGTAAYRLNNYIENGDLEQLWQPKCEKKNYRKRVEVKVPITHYVEGDIKHFYDPNWKLLMQNI